MRNSYNFLTPPEFDYCASTDILLREKYLKISSALAVVAAGLVTTPGIHSPHEINELPPKPPVSEIDTIVMHPMRIVPDKATANDLPPGFSDQEIVQTIVNFSERFNLSTQGALTVEIPDEFRQGESLPTKIVRPSGRDGDMPCYPASQLREQLPNHPNSSEAAYDTNVFLPTIPVCTTSRDGTIFREPQKGMQPSLAYAYMDNTPLTVYNAITDESGLTTGTFFRHDLPDDADKISGIIPHEQGHDLGLLHIAKIEYSDLNVSSLDIQQITSTGHGCDFARNSEGGINHYGDGSSVMGHNVDQIPHEGRRPLPPYNTADLNQLKPDVFRIEAVDISNIANIKGGKEVYPLEYGKGKLNGIQIPLPADHPLRKAGGFDNDKVVITIDPIHTTATSEKSLDYTNTVFNPIIAARGGTTNIGLPGVSSRKEDLSIIAIGNNVTEERNIIYSDKAMGVMVTAVTTKVGKKATNITLEVTDHSSTTPKAH